MSCLIWGGWSWQRTGVVSAEDRQGAVILNSIKWSLYQRKYPVWYSPTQLLMTFSKKWQNGSFLVIATVPYILILWLHGHLELCQELRSGCSNARCLSAVLVFSLAEVANAFQVVHWSYGTVFDSLGARRQRKPRRNIDSFANLISLLNY